MKRFRDLPIAWKLTLVMMLTSSAAVLLAGITTIIYEVAAFQTGSAHDLSVQAEIIGENCTAALEFDDARTAQETLGSLKARSDIVVACVYRHDGSILAGYLPNGGATAQAFPLPEVEGHRIEGGHLLLFRPIIHKGESLGTVYVRSNLQPHYARLTAAILIALGSMLVSFVLALVLASRLQRIISDPILDLADVAERVRNPQDYSLRASKRGDDEIGVLTEGFNRMLENIQERDAKLYRAYSDLQSSELRFRQLAEGISEAFWMTDPTKNEVIYISPAYEKIWKRSRESLYAEPKSWVDAIHPEDRARVLALEQQPHLEGGHDSIYRIVRPDGSIRWIRDRAFPVRDSSGKLVRLAGIAEDITERRQAEEALRQFSARIHKAQDDERRRIARELHDSTGQNMAGLAMNLTLINQSIGALPSRAQKALLDSMDLVDQCSREIRTLSYLLHPPMLDEFGLTSAVRWLIDGFEQRSGIRVEVDVTPDLGRLPQEAEIALFRIVQESLTNIQRHTASKTARVSISKEAKRVTLTIKDEGQGLSPNAEAAQGVGIAGMHERMKQLGGHLEIHFGSEGTTARAVIPINGSGIQERDAQPVG